MIAPPQSNAVTTTPSPPTDAFDFEAYTGRISDVSSPASPLSQTTSSTSSACPAHSDYLVPTKAQIIAQTSRAEMICVAHVLPRWSFYAALLMLFAFAKAMFDDLRNKPFVRRITNEK